MDIPGSISVLIAKQDGQQFSITIHPNETVTNLKKKIQEKESIPKDRQILTFCGKQLHGLQSLSDLNIKNESKISLCEILAKKPISPLNLDECKQCGFQPIDPRVLTCGHSFCFSCVSDLSQPHCPVPVCQSKFESSQDFKMNWVASSCIKKSANKPVEPIQQETLCENCEDGEEKLATKWCQTCLVNFCDNCDQVSHSLKALKNHVRESLQRATKSILLPECEKHKQEKALYCVQDDTLLCPLCLDDDHKTHSIVSFVEQSKGIRNQLFASLNPLLRRNSIEKKKEKLKQEKSQKNVKLKQLKEEVVVLEKEIVVLTQEIDEAERITKDIQVGELVLKKAIEDVHEKYLVDKEKVVSMKSEINQLLKEVLGGRIVDFGFGEVFDENIEQPTCKVTSIQEKHDSCDKDLNETTRAFSSSSIGIPKPKQEYYLFLGESGAGKSTAIEVFCGDVLSEKTKKVQLYPLKNNPDVLFFDTAGFNATDDDDGLCLDDIVETYHQYPYLTNACIFFTDKIRFDRATQESILKCLELLGYPKLTKLVICVTGLPPGDRGLNRYNEYNLGIKKLLAPKGMQYHFVSVPTTESYHDYEMLLSKLKDNGQNIETKFLAKVRTNDVAPK